VARLLRVWFLPVSVLLLATAAFIVPLPFYLEQPGGVLSLGDVVEVDAPEAEPLAGDFLLTTVNLEVATVATLLAGAVDDDVAVQPQGALIAPGIPPEDYFALQREVFQASGEVAAAVGLEAAGFPVPELTGDGAVVLRVLPDTPADGALRPGDVVVSVDGEAIATADDLRAAVDPAPLTVTVQREGAERTVEVTPAVVEGIGVDEPILGVEIDTLHPRIDLPVPVAIDSGRIGGPSAGLMIALTVYDKVVDADIAGGRQVAGTGTLSADGAVGTIGGIEQKVLAAVRDDVDLFVAPAAQADAARGAVPPGGDLQIVGAGTFDEALEALRGSGEAATLRGPPRSAPGG
jgi:PDZ domain-containing protein